MEKVKSRQWPVCRAKDIPLNYKKNGIAAFEFENVRMEINVLTGEMHTRPNGYRKRADACLEFADTYTQELARLQDAADGKKANITVKWATNRPEIKSVTAQVENRKQTQDTDLAHVKEALVAVVYSLVSILEGERRAEAKQNQKKIQCSTVYGDYICNDIVSKVINETDHYHTETRLFSELKKQYPSLQQQTITETLNTLCLEGVLYTVGVAGRYMCYDRYAIRNNKLAALYANPTPLHYGKDKEFAVYSDTDWCEVLQYEDSAKLSLDDWEARLPILDHTILLELHHDLAQKYFSNAPEGVVAYIQAMCKLEKSTLKRSVLRSLTEQ